MIVQLVWTKGSDLAISCRRRLCMSIANIVVNETSVTNRVKLYIDMHI